MSQITLSDRAWESFKAVCAIADGLGVSADDATVAANATYAVVMSGEKSAARAVSDAKAAMRRALREAA